MVSIFTKVALIDDLRSMFPSLSSAADQSSNRNSIEGWLHMRSEVLYVINHNNSSGLGSLLQGRRKFWRQRDRTSELTSLKTSEVWERRFASGRFWRAAIIRPRNPAPDPSSRTLRACTMSVKVSQLNARLIEPREDVNWSTRMLYKPICELEACPPSMEASRATLNHCTWLQERRESQTVWFFRTWRPKVGDIRRGRRSYRKWWGSSIPAKVMKQSLRDAELDDWPTLWKADPGMLHISFHQPPGRQKW